MVAALQRCPRLWLHAWRLFVSESLQQADVALSQAWVLLHLQGQHTRNREVSMRAQQAQKKVKPRSLALVHARVLLHLQSQRRPAWCVRCACEQCQASMCTKHVLRR